MSVLITEDLLSGYRLKASLMKEQRKRWSAAKEKKIRIGRQNLENPNDTKSSCPSVGRIFTHGVLLRFMLKVRESFIGR